jgi:putative membrane protein
MVVFWGIVIAGAIWLMRSVFPGVGTADDGGRKPPMSARDIIDQRYARGEITREHYLGMLEDLESMGK